jgi:hypothetical protein
MSLSITDRIDRLESSFLDWNIDRVQRESEEIESSLNELQSTNVREENDIQSLKDRVREIRLDANMAHAFDDEKISVRIADLVKPIFFGICWGLFVFVAPIIKLSTDSFAALTSFVITLHMIIQGI